MSDAVDLSLDVSAEGARALHRVVRAMHDGHCPNCGMLARSDLFDFGDRHACPRCGFEVSQEESEAALKAFAPHFQKSLDLFYEWRSGKPILPESTTDAKHAALLLAAEETVKWWDITGDVTDEIPDLKAAIAACKEE